MFLKGVLKQLEVKLTKIISTIFFFMGIPVLKDLIIKPYLCSVVFWIIIIAYVLCVRNA